MSTPIDIQTVVEDARLLMIQAATKGKLHDDALPKALAAYDMATATDTPTHAETAVLLNSLNAAIAYLGPDAFFRVKHPVGYWVEIVFRRASLIVGAFVLVLLATYASTVVTVAGRVADDVKAMKTADPYSYAFDALAKLPEPSAAERFKIFQDVRDAESSYTVINNEHKRMIELGGYFHALFSRNATVDTAAAPPRPPAAIGPHLSQLSDQALRKALAEQKTADGTDKDHTKVYALMRANHIEPNLFYQQTVKQFGNEAAAYIDLFGRWLLPVVCGLLGGLVYIMRLMLDPKMNVDLNDVAIRILAGGIAGLVVGWFMAPSALEADKMSAITATPFGLAFFAGFSIDVLFAMLDRIKRAIVDPVPPPGQPGQPG